VTVVAEGAVANEHLDAAVVLASDDATRVREQLGSGGYAVVATQGRRDLQGLKAALALLPSHLWFVASERKAGVLRQSLIAAGEDASGVARIIAPAGESIGAQTPEEIALSVLAAVVAARRGRVAGLPQAVVEGSPVTASAAVAAAVASDGGSCCGGAAKAASSAAMPAAELVPVATAVETAAPAKKSCCGN
jgi:xanthine dehydrogenase accessory factor